MLGTTWQRTLDAALDDIARRDKERQTALDALTDLIRDHPDIENNPHMVNARMALLR
jgi:hypothetical protein